MAEPNSPRSVLPLLVAFFAVGFVGVSAWQVCQEPGPLPEVKIEEMSPERVEEIQRAARMIAEVDQTPKSTGIGNFGVAPSGAVTFPDGTWLPATNGVLNPPPFPGFGGREYAPVVRWHEDPRTKQQFYMHANGSVSSVQMSEHYDGTTGETTREAVWLVGHKVPNLPLVK